MWLSKKLKDASQTEDRSAVCGAVTVGGAAAGVWTRGEERGVITAAPGGYIWKPRSGESVLVLKGGEKGNERYIVGIPENEAESSLAEGEICIHSAGGAKLYLRSDGRVEIFGELWINGAAYVPAVEGV